MRKAVILMVVASPFLLLLPHVPTLEIPAVFAQTPDGEHNCPATTAIPPYMGTGTPVFSPNQNLCLPLLAPVGGPNGPLAFIVQGVEPGIRVDSQGTIYEVSIRGVPGGIDLWRWYAPTDLGSKNGSPLLFKYEGQPDLCGIFVSGCTSPPPVVGSPGVAPGGGDADIAVNSLSGSGVPNLAVSSLSLANVTASHSIDRGDSYTPPNVLAALIPGDDRQWNDAIDTSTVYLEYHDLATFNIDVQRSNDGGFTYVNGLGEAIDPQTFPTAAGAAGSGNIAGQTRIDHSSCPTSRGNLYQIFVAPDNPTENLMSQPLRSVYVGVSTDASLGLPAFLFIDQKIFTSPVGSPGAANGTNQIFPALATDDAGFVYAVWSDQTHIYFSSSSDQGTTWTMPIQVNAGPTVGDANVFPWVAADANGHAVVVWLGANLAGNSNDRSTMEKSCSDGTNSCWASGTFTWGKRWTVMTWCLRSRSLPPAIISSTPGLSLPEALGAEQTATWPTSSRWRSTRSTVPIFLSLTTTSPAQSARVNLPAIALTATPNRIARANPTSPTSSRQIQTSSPPPAGNAQHLRQRRQGSRRSPEAAASRSSRLVLPPTSGSSHRMTSPMRRFPITTTARRAAPSMCTA